MRKWKIRFVLPVCLCCLLVCGMAVGSRYAWGVTLMQRAMAASSAYQYAHVVPAGELAQALDGDASLSTSQIVAAAEQVRQGVDGDMSPYFAGDLSQRFTQNCVSALEVPLEWGFSVDAGNTHGQLLSVEKESDTRARVRYRATSWLTTIYTYTSQGQPFYTVEVLCNRDTTTALLENQNGQWKVNQGVRPRQLPAHPRQVFHLSRGLGVCKLPGRKFHRPLCFVTRKRSGYTAPFLYVHNELPKNRNLPAPYRGERKIAAALFPRVSSALPAPKPCIRGPAG